MNHLVMTSLLMVATHIACFAAMTERKYSVKKTLLLYGLYALFFIVWALLAFMLLGKTSPHVIPFSFVGTIVPAVALFLYTSADSFSKKLFLILTYANIFCIILCLSVLLCDSLLPGLSSVGQTYARSIVRTALNIPAVLLYLGDDTTKFFVNIIIAILISVVSTAVITLLLSFKFEKEECSDRDVIGKTEENAAENIEANTTAEDTATDTRVFQFGSPVKGWVMPLEEAEDEAFASGALGQGVVIEPEEGVVRAPFDATVAALFPTNHAIGLVSDSGAEIMVHIGIDTVQLEGRYFEAFTAQESHVKAGDVLIKFDLDAIKAAGYKTQTMVIVTNSFNYKKIEAESHKSTDGSGHLMTLMK